MKHLAVLGASGHGKVVADTAEACGWQSVVFFDDAWPTKVQNGAWSVVGGTSDLLTRLADFDAVLVAIGDNRIRLEKLAVLKASGALFTSLVHPAATVSRHATVEEATVVFAGAIVNAFATIGAGCILNTGCSVDHDCVLEAGVHVSPGAHLAGGVRVGEASWIGIGACARQSLCIGKGVIVGAGAVVVTDVADGVTVTGVPARSV
ncbi:MAG: acetyltransferase [Pseudomonas sp.]|uniref:acetyltransferase n=1 Tax=Pseudomonas sp. TaxID=306 RepID=UPI003D146458